MKELLKRFKNFQNEEGNIKYRLLEAIDEPNTLMTVEEWANPTAVKNHEASEHFKTFVKNVQDFLTGPLDIEIHAVDDKK